jgi:hypothetical protein
MVPARERSMYAFLILLGALQATAHPRPLPHDWMQLGDSQSMVGPYKVTFHHYADMSSNSISPENGYRRVWLKDEWHPPEGKGLASVTRYVEMDCAGHRSRNLAFEDSEVGFMDNAKDADWQPIDSNSLEDGLCQLPAHIFLTRR